MDSPMPGIVRRKLWVSGPIELHTIIPREESGASVNVNSETPLALRWDRWVVVEPDVWARNVLQLQKLLFFFYQENTNCALCCLQITQCTGE